MSKFLTSTLYVTICLKATETQRQRSIFHLLVHFLDTSTGSGWSQGPGMPSASSTWMAGIRVLEPSPVALWSVHGQEAGQDLSLGTPECGTWKSPMTSSLHCQMPAPCVLSFLLCCEHIWGGQTAMLCMTSSRAEWPWRSIPLESSADTSVIWLTYEFTECPGERSPILQRMLGLRGFYFYLRKT